jgi:hypothetical protein
MLYDPKWEQKTDLEYAGIRLSEFIAWLETMPAEGSYDYCQAHSCAAAQYLKSSGSPECLVEFIGDGGYIKSGKWLHDLVNPAAKTKDWTFGALLDRARALQRA